VEYSGGVLREYSKGVLWWSTLREYSQGVLWWSTLVEYSGGVLWWSTPGGVLWWSTLVGRCSCGGSLLLGGPFLRLTQVDSPVAIGRSGQLCAFMQPQRKQAEEGQ